MTSAELLELLLKKSEENQTRKIYEQVRECGSIEDALKKIKVMLQMHELKS